MVDTQRDLAALQALLADNITGAISPQDLRDFLYSMKFPCGSLYLTTPAPTTISTPGTYVKAAGSCSPSDGTSSYLFTISDNRLTYTGVASFHFHIVASVSFSINQNNHIIGLRIAKNGTTLAHSTARRKVSSAGDVGSTAIHADAMLDENDYIELFVTDETGASQATIDNLYMFAMGMLR